MCALALPRMFAPVPAPGRTRAQWPYPKPASVLRDDLRSCSMVTVFDDLRPPSACRHVDEGGHVGMSATSSDVPCVQAKSGLEPCSSIRRSRAAKHEPSGDKSGRHRGPDAKAVSWTGPTAGMTQCHKLARFRTRFAVGTLGNSNLSG